MYREAERMREGNLPSRDGTQTDVNYNHETKMIMIDVNGEKEEVTVIDAIAFAGNILAMVEVVMRNGK